ncbi:ABC transporter permease [Oricola sp.]|uniref:ABC transporter permease n=1 Tax=Oricola sp. TaxID=1979950 RepID=UPI00320BFA69|nr:ABC transporter permease [Oricola sp.]
MSAIFHNVALAWYFAWSDMRARYKRSVLGPFWLVLGTVIGVVGLGLVWSVLLNTERSEFIPALTVGLVLWQAISGAITGSTTVFARSASVIKNIKTPSWRISLELVFQQTVNLIHNFVVIVFVLLVYPQDIGFAALLVIPGLVLVFMNIFWIAQVLGFVGARYRDFDPLVSALMPILFFLSPVLYQSRQLGSLDVISKLNPIAYWIEIVRNPLLGSVPALSDYLVVVAMTIAGFLLATWMTRARGHRLPYWI